MTMHDRQDELGAILAQIAMIAEDVNVIALAGSGADTTHDEQMAIIAKAQLRLRQMTKFCTLLDEFIDIAGSGIVRANTPVGRRRLTG